MKDVNRDPVRWERSMSQDKDGQYVSFHDYALLLESHDALRARVAELEAAQTESHDYWLDGRVIRKGAEYVAEIISHETLLLRELLTGKRAAQTVAVPRWVANAAKFYYQGYYGDYSQQKVDAIDALLSAPATPAKVEDSLPAFLAECSVSQDIDGIDYIELQVDRGVYQSAMLSAAQAQKKEV